MAYAKCDAHGPHVGKTLVYVAKPVLPVGFPNPAVICSSGDCSHPAKIYLTTEELAEYRAGQLIFCYPRAGAKVAVVGPNG